MKLLMNTKLVSARINVFFRNSVEGNKVENMYWYAETCFNLYWLNSLPNDPDF